MGKVVYNIVLCFFLPLLIADANGVDFSANCVLFSTDNIPKLYENDFDPFNEFAGNTFAYIGMPRIRKESFFLRLPCFRFRFPRLSFLILWKFRADITFSRFYSKCFAEWGLFRFPPYYFPDSFPWEESKGFCFAWFTYFLFVPFYSYLFPNNTLWLSYAYPFFWRQ